MKVTPCNRNIKKPGTYCKDELDIAYEELQPIKIKACNSLHSLVASPCHALLLGVFTCAVSSPTLENS